MQLECFDVQAEELSTMVKREVTGVLRVHGGDPVLLLAAYGPDWPGEWGLWLEASEGYPAALIARDLKTLSHLMKLTTVVIAAAQHPDQHAEVVRRLLSDETSDLRNDVVTVSGAVNRPAPPAHIRVWHAEGSRLFSESTVLAASVMEDRYTLYEDATK